MKLGHYRQLDGVRAIAALMVMFFHFFQGLHPTGTILLLVQKLSVIGQTGVSLFFVLSGFLITRILLVTRDSPRYFGDFYARRALRIFPLYYFFLILFYFVIPPLVHSPIVPFGSQIYFWTYLQNFAMTFNWRTAGPPTFWSLGVEEHFYLIWPFLIYFLSKKGIKWAVGVLLAVALGCRLLLLYKGYEVFYFTFSRLDEIALGALLAVWESEGKLKQYSKKFLYVLVLVLIPTLFLWGKVTGKAIPAIQAIKFNLLGVCYLCIVGYVVSLSADSVVNRMLSRKMLAFTGKISYGLYVYHPLCFSLIALFLPGIPLWLNFLLSFGSAFLIAWLSYTFMESKFIALKKYFTYTRPAITGGPIGIRMQENEATPAAKSA